MSEFVELPRLLSCMADCRLIQGHTTKLHTPMKQRFFLSVVVFLCFLGVHSFGQEYSTDPIENMRARSAVDDARRGSPAMFHSDDLQVHMKVNSDISSARIQADEEEINKKRAAIEAASHSSDEELIIDGREAHMGSGKFRIILGKLAPSVRTELYMYPSAENKMRFLKAPYRHNGESQEQFQSRMNMLSSSSNQLEVAKSDAQAIQKIAPNVKIPNLDRLSLADRKKAYYDAYRASGMSMSDSREAVEKLKLQ